MSLRLSRVLTGLFDVSLLICLMSATAPAQISPNPTDKANHPNAEEGAVFERILNHVRFENDGTEVSESEAVIRIQSQAGVEEFGHFFFNDTATTEKLE